MKKALSIVLVFVCALSLVACGSSTQSGASPSGNETPQTSQSAQPDQTTTSPPADDKYGGVLKIVNQAEGATPIGIPWSAATLESLLWAPFFEGLLIEKTNGEIITNLAEGYSVDMDNSEIVLQLRPNIKFTDGSVLTADVAGWNLMKYVEAKVLNQNISGYEARDELTLAIKFSKWSNGLLGSIASAGMISKEAYEKNGEEWAKENPVGTGPFMLTEYVRGQYLKAEKNPNYWQDGKPYLDGIEFHFIRDVMAQNMALQATGEDRIDVLNINSAEQVSMLKALEGLQVISLSTGPISMTPSSVDTASPLSSLKVRQAISMAIDRDSIAEARGFGIYTPAYQFVTADSIAHLPDDNNLPAYDPEGAKALLAEAGYPDGFTTTLITQPGVADKDATVAIQKMLEAVGITCELEFPDAGGYSHLRANGWDGICVHGTRQFAHVYSSFYLYFNKEQTFMVSAARPEGWGDALDAADQTPDVDKDTLQTLHKMLLDNLITIPIYNIYDNWVMKENIHDTDYGILNRCSLANAWMAK